MTPGSASGMVRAMSSRQIAWKWLWPLFALAACAQGASVDYDAADIQADSGVSALIDAAPADAEVPDAEAPDACVSAGMESCNGVDDDCDGEIDEGFGLGEACDSDDADACEDDQTACSSDGLDIVCLDMGAALVELCNGVDDDCQEASADGSGDPSLGADCDGPDSDLCQEGTLSCSGGMLLCSDNTASTTDICNNVDDDCDASSVDGSEDPGVGMLCDGDDEDLCNEGTLFCSGGQLACSDLSSTSLDLCNGIDDDCDPSSADGSENPQVALGCDGPDGDLCNEGVRSCNNGDLVCSDNTDTTVDLCNGVDDDCDASSADGSEDSLVGLPCDGADTDLCLEGTTQCVSSNVECSDKSGDNVELCNGSDDDCDLEIDEGFVRDTNPACAAFTDLGGVSGDVDQDILNESEGEERWYRVTIDEEYFGATSAYLSATIQLVSAASTNYDLFVYCESCDGGLAGSSTNGSGEADTVGIRRNDGSGDETFDIYIEVRFVDATACADWDLTILSDTAVALETCAAP